MKAPFLRDMPEWKESFSSQKDCFHSGMSLQKGAFIVRYGFSQCKLMEIFWFKQEICLNRKTTVLSKFDIRKALCPLHIRYGRQAAKRMVEVMKVKEKKNSLEM